MRQQAINSKTWENAVVEFFKRADECLRFGAHGNHHQAFLDVALQALKKQMESIDTDFRGVRVQWSEAGDGTETINGVVLYWSESYAKANNFEPETFVDVSISLLL